VLAAATQASRDITPESLLTSLKVIRARHLVVIEQRKEQRGVTIYDDDYEHTPYNNWRGLEGWLDQKREHEYCVLEKTENNTFTQWIAPRTAGGTENPTPGGTENPTPSHHKMLLLTLKNKLSVAHFAYLTHKILNIGEIEVNEQNKKLPGEEALIGRFMSAIAGVDQQRVVPTPVVTPSKGNLKIVRYVNSSMFEDTWKSGGVQIQDCVLVNVVFINEGKRMENLGLSKRINKLKESQLTQAVIDVERQAPKVQKGNIVTASYFKELEETFESIGRELRQQHGDKPIVLPLISYALQGLNKYAYMQFYMRMIKTHLTGTVFWDVMVYQDDGDVNKIITKEFNEQCTLVVDDDKVEVTEIEASFDKMITMNGD